MKSVKEVADHVVENRLVGFNIHYNPEDKSWNVWSRNRDTGGWSISGRHPDLELALDGVVDAMNPSPDEEEDYRLDLV